MRTSLAATESEAEPGTARARKGAGRGGGAAHHRAGAGAHHVVFLPDGPGIPGARVSALTRGRAGSMRRSWRRRTRGGGRRRWRPPARPLCEQGRHVEGGQHHLSHPRPPRGVPRWPPAPEAAAAISPLTPPGPVAPVDQVREARLGPFIDGPDASTFWAACAGTWLAGRPRGCRGVLGPSSPPSPPRRRTAPCPPPPPRRRVSGS